MVVSNGQPDIASLPREVTPGIMADANLLEFVNASSPIVVTLAGNVIDFKYPFGALDKLAKALSGIVEIGPSKVMTAVVVALVYVLE